MLNAKCRVLNEGSASLLSTLWLYMEIILHFALCIQHFYKFVMIFRKKEFTNRPFFDRIVLL